MIKIVNCTETILSYAYKENKNFNWVEKGKKIHNMPRENPLFNEISKQKYTVIVCYSRI